MALQWLMVVKVGLLNSVLERTSVFDSADPKNYQAIDNVVALGRIRK